MHLQAFHKIMTEFKQCSELWQSLSQLKSLHGSDTVLFQVKNFARQVESLILVSEKVMQSFMKVGNACIKMSVFEFEWGQIDAQTYTVPNSVLKKQLKRTKFL